MHAARTSGLVMPDYHILRAVLSVLEFATAVLIVRRNFGHLYAWVWYAWWAGTADLIPALLGDPGWWRSMWAPIHGLLMVLLIAAVWDSFRFIIPHTQRLERTMIAGAGLTIASLVIWWLSHTWAPENSFQAFCRLREFISLGLAIGFLTAWYYVMAVRPVESSDILRNHLGLLAGWLWVYWLAAAGAKGGTFWLVFSWEGGENTWRVLNAVTMSSQIALMAGWVFSLRRRRPEVSDSHARADSRLTYAG